MKCLVCGMNHASCKGTAGEPVAIVDITRRGKMANSNFVSEKRVYADKDGNVVDEKDPKRHTLVVAAGGSIPRERAVELGLLGDTAGAEASDAQAADAGDDSGEGAIDAAEESARIQGKSPKKAAGKSKK